MLVRFPFCKIWPESDFDCVRCGNEITTSVMRAAIWIHPQEQLINVRQWCSSLAAMRLSFLTITLLKFNAQHWRICEPSTRSSAKDR
jgi:hypothetical protein